MFCQDDYTVFRAEGRQTTQMFSRQPLNVVPLHISHKGVLSSGFMTQTSSIKNPNAAYNIY